jgi:hypothetical protein
LLHAISFFSRLLLQEQQSQFLLESPMSGQLLSQAVKVVVVAIQLQLEQCHPAVAVA